MKVFKFGGASVKDAEGVGNVVSVLREVGYENILIVISAMGKTTNVMETVVRHYFSGDKARLKDGIDHIRGYHDEILEELFKEKSHEVYDRVDSLFCDMNSFLASNKSTDRRYVYDQIVCFGELLSTVIVSRYLNHIGIHNKWVDVRGLIKTDNTYGDAKVQWEQTTESISKNIKPGTLYLTQGFLGGGANGTTTTLGREGSDYTAAVFAYCLGAEGVTIWKDVPGVLNADPRYFEKPKLLEKIPYGEAIELAFHGASVIHPKTLRPLQKRQIPLYVKSFLDPLSNGTCVCKTDVLQPLVSCFVVKKNRKVISLSTLDFSFMSEGNISKIFQLLHEYRMKIDMIHHSATAFLVCIEDRFSNVETLLSTFDKEFEVKYFKDISLYTVLHTADESTKFIKDCDKILLKLKSENILQVIVQE